MGGCSAPNCSSHSRKGIKVYLFPRDAKRREKWINNCRRDRWIPTPRSVLCELHFERCQFELNRLDGKVKLKPNAIPTLFDVPNPPPKIDYKRQSLFKIRNDQQSNCCPEGQSFSENDPSASTMPRDEVERSEQDIIAQLQKENEELRKKTELYEQQFKELNHLLSEGKRLQEEQERKQKLLDEKLKTFLLDEEIQALGNSGKKQWSDSAVVKGLKLRYSLGVHGYKYLTNARFPFPSYSTLCRRIQNFKLNAGIFSELYEPLMTKVSSLHPLDRFCAMSIDEMEIKEQLDFDKNRKEFFGKVTLGDGDCLGNHLTVVLIRGVRSLWKQVIACEITSSSTNKSLVKDFIERCVQFVESTGLTVISLTSDMGSNNRSFWKEVDVYAHSDGTRSNKFTCNGHEVFVVPDVCHLLKNLKSSMQKNIIILPEYVQEMEGLPSNEVTGHYIADLWEKEINDLKEIRALHHLNAEDINPDNYHKMNVGAAVRYFSPKTSSAIRLAVQAGLLPNVALTTAGFIDQIYEWFDIVSSRTRKTSISLKNNSTKIEILYSVINLFQHCVIQKGWKPLNTGVILASLSLSEISVTLLNKGFDFVMLHRFNQDALENIFSQVRRRGGLTPSALTCLTSLKIITISQFLSDIKHSNYSNDSDIFLLESFKKVKENMEVDEQSHPLNVDPSLDPSSGNLNELISTEMCLENSSLFESNLIYYLAGCCLNKVIKKELCDNCKSFLNVTVDNFDIDLNIISYSQMRCFKNGINSLTVPNNSFFSFILKCNAVYLKYKRYIMLNGFKSLLKQIETQICEEFPNCCNMKTVTINHFFTIISFSTIKLCLLLKKKKQFYGTASKKFKTK